MSEAEMRTMLANLMRDQSDGQREARDAVVNGGSTYHSTAEVIRAMLAAEAAAIERMQSPVAWCIEQAGEIMAISSGCANTHGDPGGGLQMINSIASDIAINLQMTEPASLRTPTKAPDHG